MVPRTKEEKRERWTENPVTQTLFFTSNQLVQLLETPESGWQHWSNEANVMGTVKRKRV
jgi:hypothetical protein